MSVLEAMSAWERLGQIWTPNIDPHFGPRIWTPFWTHNMDHQYPDRKVDIKNNQLGIKLIPMISTWDQVDPTWSHFPSQDGPPIWTPIWTPCWTPKKCKVWFYFWGKTLRFIYVSISTVSVKDKIQKPFVACHRQYLCLEMRAQGIKKF
jgi:hypothetical protein